MLPHKESLHVDILCEFVKYPVAILDNFWIIIVGYKYYAGMKILQHGSSCHTGMIICPTAFISHKVILLIN